jgi:hypothetical protein
MANTSNRIKLTDYLLGQQSSTFGRNYVINPSAFENVNNVTVAGSATVSQNTTTPLTAVSDFQIALTNDTTDSVTWALNTLDNSLSGQNCLLSFDYTASSMGSAVQAQVLQGSNIVGTATLAVQSTSSPVLINVPCGNLGSATTVAIANITGNSGSSALHVANINYGKATNLSQVSQAQEFGTIKWNATASSEWTTAADTSTPTAFGTNSNAPTPSTTGNCAAPGTKIPACVLTSIPSGILNVYLIGSLQSAGGTNSYCNWFINDGTTSWPAGAIGTGASSTVAENNVPLIMARIPYTTSQSNITLQPYTQCQTASVLATIDNRNNGNSGAALMMVINYTPSSSTGTIAVNSNNTASMVTVDTGNGYGSTNTKVRRFTNVRQTLGNAITYADSASIGGTWTINQPGTYSISYSDQSSIGAGDIGIVVNGTAGTTSINNVTYAQGLRQISTTSTTNPGDVSWTGVLKQGDVIWVQTDGNANSTTATSMVTVTNSVGSQASPILVGSVTSAGSGQYHIESATVVLDGASSSIVSQSGSWLSFTSYTSPKTTFGITAGEFSATPTCQCTAFLATATASTSNAYTCMFTTESTSSLVILPTSLNGSEGGPSASFEANIICMGPH